MRKLVYVVVMVLCTAFPCLGQTQRSLLQSPTVSSTEIAFAHGGDIWIVSREGGEARRLVTGMDRLSGPIFSPDGTLIAYTGEYDGNLDVYVVAAAGGEPRRLTYHPGPDEAAGWTPDGKGVLFSSRRDSANDSGKLFIMPLEGGFPAAIPLPMAEWGSLSADGKHIAYMPVFQWEPDWKHYHGGQTTPIWIADLSDSSVVKVPRDNSNDRNPMWVGKTVYFLSDREGPVTLFAYDTETQKVSQVIKNDGFDIKSASAGPGAIVYEQFGTIHLYDLAKHESKIVDIRVAADMPQVRPHFVKVATATQNQILNQGISPTGARAVFEAHGEILTVPAEKGDIRNITQTTAAAERDPAWSPDGKSIAYFSDESGEYALHIRPQNGIGAVRKIDLGSPPSFFYTPTWSPDSKKIAYSDKRLGLWYVDLEKATRVPVDTDYYDEGPSPFGVVWSPDSRWIAYQKILVSHLHAVFVASVETGKVTQITDGMSDAVSPAFDENGKYLYFAASTDIGLSAAGDMSGFRRPVTRSVYAIVLSKDLPSPVPPESDDEKIEEAKKGNAGATASADQSAGSGGEEKGDSDKVKAEGKKPEPVKVTIDFEDIGQRIVAMPIPAQNYVGLTAGKTGILYLQEMAAVPVPGEDGGPPPMTLQRFDLKTRKTEKLLDNISAFTLSFDGEKMLYQQQKKWFIAAADKAPAPGTGQLKTDDMEVYVDPRAEWKQMYHEVWRIERDFFYDPHYHGLNLDEAQKTFAPYLSEVTSRDDLNYLFREMLSYMSVGHMFVGGGAQPDTPKVQVGLLGADYNIENGRYRFAKVFSGENWNPQLHAPLTQPGVNVKAGEYLLAVNGHDLHAADNVYSLFQETAGRQTVIRVGPNADGSGARDVTVVPVPSEDQLRHLDWVEGNRRRVDELSGGKLAYVHLPDTGTGGFTSFNRYYFSQVGRQGAVIDERYNHGGRLADYIVDYLRRPLLNKVETREGHDDFEPAESIYGPKVMIINQFAGSGGDALPWYFRKLAIGPLIGQRTWGGLIGIGGYPDLMDGGYVMAPRWAIYGLKGEWEVENHGIAPDIAVDMDPKQVREGHDPQLEKAVDVALELLKKNPPQTYERPAYPDYHPKLPAEQ